jgi:hypothetical protein
MGFHNNVINIPLVAVLRKRWLWTKGLAVAMWIFGPHEEHHVGVSEVTHSQCLVRAPHQQLIALTIASLE